ncbi:MAG: hypothetical protein ACLFWL_04250 [Candidatus Brocadiia bacterium]
MSERGNNKSFSPVTLGGIVAVIIVVFVLAFTGGPSTDRNGGNAVADLSGNENAPGEKNNSDAPDLSGWDQFQPSSRILIKAADAESLHGKMEIAKADDNKDELTPEGTQATVEFVYVKDNTCGEGDDPAVHKAKYTFEVEESGTYYPWVRVWWEDSCANSFDFSLREKTEEKGQSFMVTDGTKKWWHWLELAGESGIELQKGSYELYVINREDGARLSRVLFSGQDYSHVPETPDG